MLSKLKIKGFQSHKDTEFIFDPGLNAIIGQSDSGKTASLRALEWLCYNRPRGEGFQSWWEDVDKTTVEGMFDEDVITKTRSKVLNQYQINKKEPLKALRADVPDEVKAVLKMSEINLQKQHEPYFLLQDTASNIASKFNDMAGLQVMDECVAQAKGLVRSLKQQSERLFEEITVSENAVRDMDWVEQAEKDIQELCLTENTIEELKSKVSTVEKMLLMYDECVLQLTCIDTILVLLNDVESAIILYNDAQALRKKVASIEDLLTDHTVYKEKAIVCDNSIALDNDVKQAEVLYEKIKDSKAKIVRVQKSVQEFCDVHSQIEKIQTQIEDAESVFHSQMCKYEGCPLCGHVVGDKQ